LSAAIVEELELNWVCCGWRTQCCWPWSGRSTVTTTFLR
jgi:hypothetical protein